MENHALATVIGAEPRARFTGFAGKGAFDHARARGPAPARTPAPRGDRALSRRDGPRRGDHLAHAHAPLDLHRRAGWRGHSRAARPLLVLLEAAKLAKTRRGGSLPIAPRE